MPLIAVVTPLFPISKEIYRGQPIYQTVVALQRHADVRVFCPMTNYPSLFKPRFRHHQQPDKTYRPAGVEATYFDYPVFPLLSRPLNGRVCRHYLARQMEGLKFDMILSFWLYPDSWAAMSIARKHGKPIVASARGSDLRRIQDAFTRRYVRQTVRSVDRLLTVSEELRRQAIAMGAAPENVRTIVNGCDSSRFHPMPRRDVRAGLKIGDSERIILFVGRVEQAKGAHVLVDAFARLAADPSLRLVFVGGGQESFRSVIEGHGLSDRVHLAGPAGPDTVALWMNAADVFCLPSFSEGCPNVVLEATAAGCPVVANNVGGVPEIVSPENGVLVDDHEPETLARALRAALDRSWDRETISRHSTRTWNDVGDETYALCAEVMERRRP